MPSEQTILAFDTSAAHCAAALVCGDTVLATRVEEMGRGQAERLMPLLAETLAEAGKDWADLTRIAVGIGPGNFTGIRISVSAARGLALGLGIPAVGVSLFETTEALSGSAKTAIPAPRDQAYLNDGTPRLAPMTEAAGFALSTDYDARAHVTAMAQIAATKATGQRPAPLYIKPADAAPSRDAPPVILDVTP
ncbi:tRNA (adenosine(37)-N6)-threonylcarbamoyltransferase complex dimerization subunit type 1 TsaB [Tropicibacter naphthalenivorans]|uniref:UGMP family protein n=1 Tax=Tropicibacter naphthalenivorans TaxID=441103 RepID=A0A0P1GIR9_9RHOB|nr:tRNA (adenosine(37)-N6)-threonylcarbamoyltransferase complex dimerization subunit type 1 TsaB [Tropicibacter naphthalenivorans]CUH75412.1 UGMP family protein [Tropicibacter naphthalenivorans]SMC44605.1 tRNA threonylcarbamoyl adenosine modification protein YeaZ [Tropicibacter naphthalenivorans]